MTTLTAARQDGTLASVTDGNSGTPTIDSMARLITHESYQQLVLAGHVHCVNRGSATTPIDFVKTTYDEDQAQLVVRVPSGTVIVPLELEVVLETSGGTLNEVIWGWSENDVGAGTSTAITGRNMRTDAPNSTAITIQRDYTGNFTTAVSNLTEIFRDTYAFADAGTDPHKVYRLSIKEHVMPVLVGAASLILWVVGGTAPTGYATVKYAEFSNAQAGV